MDVNNGKPLHIAMAMLPKADKPQAKATALAEQAKGVNIFSEYYLIEVEHFQNIIHQPIDE